MSAEILGQIYGDRVVKASHYSVFSVGHSSLQENRWRVPRIEGKKSLPDPDCNERQYNEAMHTHTQFIKSYAVKP